MKETLAVLVAAQRLDERLLVLQRRLASLPAELAERRARAAALEAGAEALESERKNALLRAQSLETDVRQHEQRVRKIEQQLLELRDAGAAAVMRHEAQELRDKISRAEEEALALLERGEALVAEREQARAAAKAYAGELAEFAAAVAADQAELGAQQAALSAERETWLARVPGEPAETYQRLIKARKGVALAPLRGNSCGACGMLVPPNDRVRVLAMAELCLCRSCGRIQVTAELWGEGQPAAG